MGSREAFYQVLSLAIDDLMEHGFDSQERLDRWLHQLRQAARNALIPEETLVRTLNDSLGLVFRRSTTDKKLLQIHPGISQFTLQNIKPKLRSELNRRIQASANLITLNRDASIARTLQRFAGWGMSVPMGGTEVVKRKEVKQTIRRGIAGLPMAERLVIVDQSHKLVAAINEIVAIDGGAIALIWKHVNERGHGYTPRPNHVARDGKIYVMRDSWALKQGLMKPAGAQYYDEVTAVGEEINCRCTAVWLFTLRDLPQAMLTAKGKEALLEARKILKIA